MKVAFYKYGKRRIDRLISWYLCGPYSHVELVMGQGQGGHAVCLSSSRLDGGVRIKHMHLDPKKWDLVDVDVAPEVAYAWAREHIGQEYDLAGLLGFLWRRQQGAQTRWFCSEAVAAVLGFAEPWRFDPCSLHAVLTRQQITREYLHG